MRVLPTMFLCTIACYKAVSSCMIPPHPDIESIIS
jgi:hypothetical protein